jgi:hypothetical protein
MENGAGEKVAATSEDLKNPELVHAAFYIKHPDASFTQMTQEQINTPA